MKKLMGSVTKRGCDIQEVLFIPSDPPFRNEAFVRPSQEDLLLIVTALARHSCWFQVEPLGNGWNIIKKDEAPDFHSILREVFGEFKLSCTVDL